MLLVRDLGEFGLIERLKLRVAQAHLLVPEVAGFQLHLGIGDDAAAWHVDGGIQVVTTDAMVEDTHFNLNIMSWMDVGWKLIVVNLSDIAAMGATPLCLTVTLGLPPSQPIKDVDELYDGILEACKNYRTLVVGGDIVSSPTVFLSVTLYGVAKDKPLTRTDAQPGDAIALTGPLGSAACGLELLNSTDSISGVASISLAEAHRRPKARLQEGQKLLQDGIRCAIDISDGLIADLSKLCVASGVAAELTASLIPLANNLKSTMPDQALEFGLNGGEDYELIFTGQPHVVKSLMNYFPQGAIIGKIKEGPPGHLTLFGTQGKKLNVANHGWDHFR